MRKFVSFAAFVAVFFLALPRAFAAAPPASKSGSGSIVIVFKDGHRQSFNLADIARIDFPGAIEVAGAPGSPSSTWPPRGHFVGKWEAGDGNGSTFFITLNEDGSARRSIGNVRGRWLYVNGEAQVTWDDGAMDAIRKIGTKYQKFAYEAGMSFTDTPANVTDAHNTTPHPI
jgi:hypothetical protein